MTEVKINLPVFQNQNRSFRYYIRLFFHILSVFVFGFVGGYALFLWYLLITEAVEVDDPGIWAIKWLTPCFATNWNVLFQTCFLTMSLAYDILEWADRHDTQYGRKLKFYRDVLFSGIVVPLTLFISTMFWTVFWIDRELVFPQVYDQIVPWWFNHCVHTNILIVVGLETILQARRHPANMKLELWLNGIIGVGYAIVYYSIFFITNRWLYAVFGIMTWWQVCLYQILIWGSTFVFYAIQFPINRIFHKEETSEIKEQKTEQNTVKREANSVNSWNANNISRDGAEHSSL